MHRLVSAQLLRALMQRTGTGADVTVRELEGLTGVPRSTIGALLTGTQKSVPKPAAEQIAKAIGVDLLILWIPDERAATHRANTAAAVAG
ncbi:helix-turn-helix domain-containing protein [Streptomyces sp. NPDC059015]|uniref:helix-turn-helix domain-containing protein n=1 Tax=unclassified Streptomyces TaxID=2593676 RepID=UPI0036D1F8E6